MSAPGQVLTSPTPVTGPNRTLIGAVPAGVLLSALAVVLLRLPFINGAPGPDEGGFLAVGGQWDGRGTSLYGNYWVDRPPLLIMIFRVAAQLGGTPALRMIGIGAAVVAVLAVARAAHVLSGRRAATWASVAAAAFLVSPLAGSSEVNGELLAAPFVALAIAAATEARARRAALPALLAGAFSLLAVLVKQNMLDGFVFAGVLLLLGVRDLGSRRLLRIGAAAAAGALLAGGAVALCTVAHGTSLSGVWFAMYRFRLEADAVMAAFPSAGAHGRALVLLRTAVTSGMGLVGALLVVSLVGRRRPTERAAGAALTATVFYDVVSVYLGGNYWSHYLVQLAVPLGLAVGLVAARHRRTGQVAAALVTVSALVSIVTRTPPPPSATASRLGAEIAAVARPGDTVVTAWGRAQVVEGSGLRSPYPYLWSLPARTLDPRMTLLTSTLAGSRAPTWFVTWSGLRVTGVDTSALSSVVRHDYHRVGRFHGHAVYLHNGVTRASLPG